MGSATRLHRLSSSAPASGHTMAFVGDEAEQVVLPTGQSSEVRNGPTACRNPAVFPPCTL